MFLRVALLSVGLCLAVLSAGAQTYERERAAVGLIVRSHSFAAMFGGKGRLCGVLGCGDTAVSSFGRCTFSDSILPVAHVAEIFRMHVQMRDSCALALLGRDSVAAVRPVGGMVRIDGEMPLEETGGLRVYFTEKIGAVQPCILLNNFMVADYFRTLRKGEATYLFFKEEGGSVRVFGGRIVYD